MPPAAAAAAAAAVCHVQDQGPERRASRVGCAGHTPVRVVGIWTSRGLETALSYFGLFWWGSGPWITGKSPKFSTR